MQNSDITEASNHRSVAATVSDEISGMESEFFPRHKIPSYFTQPDEEDEEDGLETRDSAIGSSNDKSNLVSTSIGVRSRSASASLSPTKEDYVMISNNLKSPEADAAAGSSSVIGGAVGGSGESTTSNVMSRVTSIKSMLSVSNLVSMNRESSTTLANPTTPANHVTYLGERSSNAKTAARPRTSYITSNSDTGILTTGSDSLGSILLNDLNLLELGLNLEEPKSKSKTIHNITPKRLNDGMDANVVDLNDEILPSWRLKERMKTVGVGLILALNIGTDPPDVSKPNPCAKLQCWMDPSSTSRTKARDRIGELLELQYARWQGQQRARLKVKRALDPTVDDVRNLCYSLRRAAKNERILLHYNGHGVPRPTSSGEIWVFDKNHTQYIPFAVSDLRKISGKPSLVVLDCSGAGALLPFLTAPDDTSDSFTVEQSVSPRRDNTNSALDSETFATTTVREIIVLCPTSESETLPMNPELPADLFTSCLTTPIAIALRWFIRQNPLSCSKIDPDCVEKIPGKLNDRKTPLGELNWIFTAITDTIAWNVLPTPIFQSLFRQDLMVASMFRNFLLADRILRELNCTPMSYPAMPSTSNHPLWSAWDLAVESCISQLIRDGLLNSNRHQNARSVEKGESDEMDSQTNTNGTNSRDNLSNESTRGPATRPNNSALATATHINPDKQPHRCNVSAPFFAEQLTAFENWLEFASNRIKSGGVILDPPQRQHENSSGKQKLACYMYPGMSRDMESPDQLPVVLQVLLSPAHRVRALVLLRRFLNLGPSAVNLALSVGICPYVLRLLQSPIDEYKHLLIGIWQKILEFDPSCQVDLVKDRALPHFIKHLSWIPPQTEGNSNPNEAVLTWKEEDEEDEPSHQRTMAAVILSAICRDFNQGQTECLKCNLHGTCADILQSFEHASGDPSSNDNPFPPMFRMWLCICLGMLCKDNTVAQAEIFKANIHLRLIARLDDNCSGVRAAACFALGNLINKDKQQGLMGMVRQNNNGSRMLSPTQGHSSLNLYGTTQGPGMQNLPWQQQQLTPLQSHAGGHSLSPMAPIPSHGQQIGLPGIPNLSNNSISSGSMAVQDNTGAAQDTYILRKVLLSFNDASSVVRYEVAVVLGKIVQKYLAAFVAVAKSFVKEKTEKKTSHLTMPKDITKEMEEIFVEAWKKNRSSHENDPHLKVAKATTKILKFVNKKIFRHENGNKRRDVGLRPGPSKESNFSSDPLEPSSMQHRTKSAMNLTAPQPSQDRLGSTHRNSSLVSISEHGTGRQISKPKRSLHRSLTAGGTREDATSSQNEVFLFTQDFTAHNIPEEPEPELSLCSKFYEWKKELFESSAEWSHKHCNLDPLNPEDAIFLYQVQRNLKIDNYTKKLSESFADLYPVPNKKRSVYGGFADFDDNDNEEEKAAGEYKIAAKKKSLKLKEMTILPKEGPNFPKLLKFHSYESVLATSDGTDNISVWNINNSTKVKTIKNSNPGNTRITSMLWINERNRTKLLSGCDDGSVRIWDKVLKQCSSDDDHAKPELASAFYALPELEPGNRRKSGLIAEWQQSEGRIIAGGATKFIRCWDLESEKLTTCIDTNISFDLTAFTTAWDYVHNESAASGFSGIGPDVLVGGFGDGTVKVFDLRVREKQGAAMTLKESPKILRRGRERVYTEHKSWIVNLSYTHGPNSYQIVSGAIAGDVRWWDLRAKSSSIRTIEIQRSPMTAMACHSKIPLLASGSDANFVKIWTPDGDALQVIRHHERLNGRRIGRVSSLDFHPSRPLLAAAFTDHHISIYSQETISQNL